MFKSTYFKFVRAASALYLSIRCDCCKYRRRIGRPGYVPHSTVQVKGEHRLPTINMDTSLNKHIKQQNLLEFLYYDDITIITSSEQKGCYNHAVSFRSHQFTDSVYSVDILIFALRGHLQITYNGCTDNAYIGMGGSGLLCTCGG